MKRLSLTNARTTRLVALLVCSLVLVACAGSGSESSDGAGAKPERGGEVTILRNVDIDSWDPDKALQTGTFETLPQVMEGLVRPSADGDSIDPGLAKKWTFDAKAKTITFELRPNLRFSDGTPLTADDVVFSVGLWRENVAYGTLYSAISGATAPDPSTVVITMNRPSTFTLSWLANATAVIVPKDFAGKKRDDFFKQPIGAGPFTIDSYTPGQTLVLKRNSEYYDAKRPYVDSVTYKVVVDANQQLLQYQNKQAQILESVPLDVAKQLPDDERKLVSPSSTVHAAFINTATGPGTDIHFRRAVSYAIDRSSYVKSVFGGFAKPATGGLPAGVQGSAECDCTYESDVAKAKDELAQSTYDGSSVVVLVDSSSPVSTRGGQVAAKMLNDIGIKADLQPEESQVMFDRYSKGDFVIELAEISSVSPSVGDIFGLVSYMVSTSDKDKVIETAFGKLDLAASGADQKAATATAENWIGENLPYVPIAYPDRIMAISTTVKGLEVTPYLTYRADQIWVR